MRSDLLLTLTGHKTGLPRDKFGRPIMSGPHENILIKMALEEKKESPDMTQFTAEMFELEIEKIMPEITANDGNIAKARSIKDVGINYKIYY